MASLQELNSYTGNAALGAGTQGNLATIGEPKFERMFDAVDRLTAYTMQMNRDLWVQSNVKLQQTADQAARDLSITYGDLIPEDREEIDKTVAELYDYYDKNPNAVRYNIDPSTGENNRDEYKGFLELKNRLDHLIVRGNLRAHQLYGAQEEISKQTDPKVIEAMRSSLEQERKKPIGENILIPPSPTQFNWSSYIDGKSQYGAQDASFIQRFPNDILDVTMKMFDPIKAGLSVVNDLNGDTPVSEDLKKNLAQQRLIVDQVLAAHTHDDGQGNKILDAAGLATDPNAIPLLNQIKFYNDYIDKLNTRETVESGTTTKQKVRQLMGYDRDIPRVDINNLSDMDLVHLGLTYKMGVSTNVKAMPTDNAIQMRGQDLGYKEAMARLQWDKDKFNAALKEGKNGENNIADEKLLQYYNFMNAPNNGMGVETFEHDKTFKNGKPITDKVTRSVGFEVGLTPQLTDAFSIPVNKEKVKSTSIKGSKFGDHSTTDTETEVTAKRPARIFVFPDKGGDPNKNRVQVKYDDNTIQDFSSAQVFSAFNKIFGQDAKVQSKVSEVAMKRLNEWGLTQPDVNAIGRRLGNLQQGSSDQGGGAAPAKTSTGKKPTPYKR